MQIHVVAAVGVMVNEIGIRALYQGGSSLVRYERSNQNSIASGGRHNRARVGNLVVAREDRGR